MKKVPPPMDPEAYVAALSGWRQKLVTTLRKNVLVAETIDEQIKWGHLVYFAKGPVLLIRAEAERVLFGFWRGQRLLELEPRLKKGGKYEMATLEFREGMTIKQATVRRLMTAAIALNQEFGDPTLAAKPRKYVKKAAKSLRGKKTPAHKKQ
jgi:hypothetical protein